MTQTVLLGDICMQITDGTHSTVKDNPDGDYYLLSAKNIKDRIVTSSNERKIDKETLESLRKRTKTAKNDVLVTSVGTIGETAIVQDDEPNYEFQRSVLILKPDTSLVSPQYLYYYMRMLKSQFISMATGAVQKCLFIGQMKSVQIELPDLEVQKKIADILGTIDEKIELNRQMNETLEQMGQALFRHYFIDNPEAETGSGAKVSDFAEHLKMSVQPMKFPDTTFHQYSIPGYDNSYSPEVSRGETIKSGKYEVASNSILVSKLNPATPRVWAVIEPQDNAVCSTEFQVIKPKDSYAFCYFLLTSREFTEKMTMSAGGTSNSHRRVKPSDILDFAFARPREEALTKFEAKVRPMIEQINANRDEIQTLTTLRDTLLPRLINGKVKL